tara:strand:- start:145262 stop:146068 length:807 start_codon:yes stop_codon:yes gene_type:complete
MKRIQLFEFEDQSWFPSWMRTSLNRLIRVLLNKMGITESASTLINQKLKESNSNQVVDLGSGAGGVMIDVFKNLKATQPDTLPSFILTDLYPSESHVDYVNKLQFDQLRYDHRSINALNLDSTPSGLKTMFNAFHHLRPNEAQRLLESAAKAETPILMYEMADNRIPLILWWLFLPVSLIIVALMCLFLTPMVRPLTFKQLFFTYVIPIIPITYAWDGQASYPRIYTFSDIEELIQNIDMTNYTFEIDYLKNKKGKKQGYYIFGNPKK